MRRRAYEIKLAELIQVATFKIYDTAGAGAYMPYADATVYSTVGVYQWGSKVGDNGDWAAFDSSGPIDIAVNYSFKTVAANGTTTYHDVTDLAFVNAYGQVIGEISGVSMEAYTVKAGWGALDDKVINGGDDIFEGNNYGDVIHGGSGSDLVRGLGGDDVLFGDNGDDVLVGGAGDDAIDGGAGTDAAVFGGPAEGYILQWLIDRSGLYVTDLSGADGTDYVHSSTEYVGFIGGTIVDTLNSGWFGVHFLCSAGNDHVTALNAGSILGGANVLDGGAGHDFLQGGSGNDRLNGGTGFDWLEGGSGVDVLYGGSGTDAFVFSAPPKTGKDAIKDFNVRDDYVSLENSFFKVGSGLSASELPCQQHRRGPGPQRHGDLRQG